MAAFGNLTMIGDSLFRGDSAATPPFYAPAQSLQGKLSTGGHTATFVGNQNADPGSIPVCASGGRTIALIQADISNVVAAAPLTVIISIGTNNLGVSTPTAGTQITTYLNDLETALGAGKKYYVFAPVNLTWFHQASWTLLRDAMSAWCAARSSNAFFGDLTASGLAIDTSDGIGDGTHWSSTGAVKIATYIDTIMDASVAGPLPPSTPSGVAAVFKGFDINSLRTAATALPVGQQKAKYSADVVGQIGSNAIFEIRIGTTVLYRSTISGALTSSSSGIPFPTQFTEPPTANVANALTDANAVIVLRNASNASIEVLIPVKAGGAANFLTASAALDGTKTVRTSGLLLVPPSVLDVAPSGGGSGTTTAGAPTITRAQIITDMTTQSVSQPRFGNTNNREAAIQAANRRNVLRYEAIGPAATHKFSDYMNEILPWFWPYAGPGHDDSLNLRLQWDAGVISVKRASDGVWVDSSLRAGSAFDGYIWYGNGQQFTLLTSHGDYRDHPDGSRSSQFKGNLGAEVWMTALVNRNLMLDCKEVAIACRARVIDNNNNPYYGSGANYVSKMGFDFYARGNPGATSGGEGRTSSGLWARLANGSNSRFIGFTNGDWKTCAMITCPSYNSTPGNANSGSDSTPDAVFAPYVMTTANITAGDHPSWVIP